MWPTGSILRRNSSASSPPAQATRARATEVANRLGVAHPTALKCIARLKREGCVTSRPYRGVFLTPAGQAMAERSFQILVNREHGSTMVTQFIGNIPLSKAEPHRHLYEETLIFLRGVLKSAERTVLSFSSTIKRVKRKPAAPKA